MTTKKKRPAKRKVKATKPCKTCGGIGVIFPRFLGRDVGDTDEPDTLRATVERCDTCRKYADDHEASHAAEQKMRLYDEIMAERPPKEDA
jgi:hypothetical protein